MEARSYFKELEEVERERDEAQRWAGQAKDLLEILEFRLQAGGSTHKSRLVLRTAIIELLRRYPDP